MSSSSLNRPARLNRALLALTGLALLTIAAFTLLLGMGPLARLWPVFDQRAPLVPSGVHVQFWVPYLVVVLAVVIGLGCVRWLLAQTLRRPPTRTWRLTADSGRGTTHLHTDEAAAAIAADIQAYRGVAKAGATLTGPRAQPELHLLVHTETGTDIGPLRERIATHALPRLRAALEMEHLPAELLLRLDTTAPASRAR
jgi:hypothetical protein